MSRDRKGLGYFWQIFCQDKKLYPTSYFFFPLKTRKEKIPLTKVFYKKIIQTYLDIYFNEFYSENKPKYFMLSGELIKVRGNSIIGDRKNDTFKEIKSIGWIWYFRPSLPYISNIKIIKLKGSTSRLNKIEKRYHLSNDIGTLRPCRKVYRELLETNKLFRND